MDENEINDLLRKAQPGWVKDGKGIRGDAVTQVQHARESARNPDLESAYSGKATQGVIPQM